MSVALAELHLVRAGDVAVAEFDEPVIVVGGHVAASSWSGPDPMLTLGTADEPDRFGTFKIASGIDFDLARVRGSVYAFEPLVFGSPIGAVRAEVPAVEGSAGSGEARVRLLVAVPRIVEAAS